MARRRREDRQETLEDFVLEYRTYWFCDKERAGKALSKIKSCALPVLTNRGMAWNAETSQILTECLHNHNYGCSILAEFVHALNKAGYRLPDSAGSKYYQGAGNQTFQRTHTSIEERLVIIEKAGQIDQTIKRKAYQEGDMD